MHIRSGQLTALLTLTCLFGLGWTLQSQMLLNWDVSWLMYASQRLLAGGSYTKDFFEVNPPLILYLYIPPVLLAKYLAISLPNALRLCVFCTAALSLSLCYPSLQTLFPPRDKRLQWFIFLMLVVVFLILPMHEFGQREHLLVIFAMPYFLLMSRRLANGTVPTSLAVTIGLFSGLGFALKPYFLIAPFLIELYYWRQQRRLSVSVRPETLALFCLLLCYSATILILHRDYLQTVIPLVQHIAFYSAYSSNWKMLLLNAYAIFSVLVLLLALTQYEPQSRYNPLITVLLLAIIGSLLAYLTQHTAWYYHASPTHQLATLLATLLLVLLATRANALHYTRRLLLAFGIAILVFYIFWGADSSLWQQLNTAPFYVLTAAVFVALYYLADGNTPAQKIGRCTMSAVLMIVILSFPLVNAYQTWRYAASRQATLIELITFLRLHAWHKPVYYLANSATDTLPVITAAEAVIATRMEDAGWIPGLLQREQQGDKALLANKAFLINMIADDLNKNKPEYILVDRGNNSTHTATNQFDYVTYLSTNTAFRQAFQPYRFFLTLEKKPFYRFDIYQRATTQSAWQNT